MSKLYARALQELETERAKAWAAFQDANSKIGKLKAARHAVQKIQEQTNKAERENEIIATIEAGASFAQLAAKLGVSPSWARAAHYKALRARERAAETPDTATVEDDFPIDKLLFSIRTHNALNNLSVTTIGDLCRLSESDLRRVRNIGKKSIIEIVSLLAKYGRRLRK